MEPVQVRLYGLFPVTKRRYLRQLLLTAVLLAVLFGLWFLLPVVQTPPDPRAGLPAHLEAALWLLRNLHWIIFGLAVLVCLEAVFVLRRFAQAEATSARDRAGPGRAADTTGTSPVARQEGVNEGSG